MASWGSFCERDMGSAFRWKTMKLLVLSEFPDTVYKMTRINQGRHAMTRGRVNMLIYNLSIFDVGS